MNGWGHTLAALLFHDRTPFAWIVVVAYFVGAVAAYWAGSGAKKRERLFWIGAALVLAFLGLNKQLDLQTYLTNEGRLLAQQEGWYEQRRLAQGAFMLALGVAAVLSIAALVAWLRTAPVQVKSAAFGIVLLFVFVIMRAGSFHHMDEWVTINMAGLRSGWWLELTGIVVIALSAFAYRKRRKRR